MDLIVTGSLTIPSRELGWRFSRSSGPGGQHVNTSDSRVELSWDVASSPSVTERQRDVILAALDRRIVDGVVTVSASERRSQLRNRELARARLAALLAEALRPPAAPRRPTRPSRGAVARRLGEKAQRAETKRSRRRPDLD